MQEKKYKYRKKSLLRFYKITFPREKALLFRARKDRNEISYQSRRVVKGHEVLTSSKYLGINTGQEPVNKGLY